MSDKPFSDRLFSSRIFPVILLVFGFILLIIGRSNLLLFLDGFSDTITVRPDHQILWILIFAVSLIAGGFLGLYRNYLYNSEETDSE